jgi:hypothetical protein
MLEFDFLPKFIRVNGTGVDGSFGNCSRAAEGFLSHKEKVAATGAVLNACLNIDEIDGLKLFLPYRRSHCAMLTPIGIAEPFWEGPEYTVEPHTARVVNPGSPIELHG